MRSWKHTAARKKTQEKGVNSQENGHVMGKQPVLHERPVSGQQRDNRDVFLKKRGKKSQTKNSKARVHDY